MKNEEEPLPDSPRGNPSTRWSVADDVETTGSLSRLGAPRRHRASSHPRACFQR